MIELLIKIVGLISLAALIIDDTRVLVLRYLGLPGVGALIAIIYVALSLLLG